MKSRRPYLLLLLLNAASVLATWSITFVPMSGEPAPGLSIIHRYWDGPAFVVVGWSLYDPADAIWEYYGRRFEIRGLDAHPHATVLILYPLVVRFLAPLFGYFGALPVAALLFSSLSVVVFYKVFSELRLVRDPLWAATVFLFFPPRWLLYHSVGATEPPFLIFVLCAFYFYRKRRLGLVGLFGALAAVTRIFGVLLLPAFLLAELARSWHAASADPSVSRGRELLRTGTRTTIALLPIPALLLAHFALYQVRLGDFWAYFTENARQLSGLPLLAVFRASFEKPADAYANALLFMPLAYAAVWHWRRGQKDVFFLLFFLTLPTLFTYLPDATRFLSPIYPFVFFAPFDRLWSRPEAKWALFLSLPLTYAYVWGCLLENVMPLPIYESLCAFLAAHGGL